MYKLLKISSLCNEKQKLFDIRLVYRFHHLSESRKSFRKSAKNNPNPLFIPDRVEYTLPENKNTRSGIIFEFPVDNTPERVYNSIMNTIAEFVKQKRKEAGLTQEEFAIRSGLGLRFVRELEQGKETVRMDKVNQALAMFGAVAVPGRIQRGGKDDEK